jgi:hypothetical protein
VKPVDLDLDNIPKATRKKAEAKPPAPMKHADWRRIVRSLRVDGPQTIRSLTENLGGKNWFLVSWTTRVKYLIGWFLDHGVVERVGRKYKLTEYGANWGKPQPRRTGTPRTKKPNAWDHILDSDD